MQIWLVKKFALQLQGFDFTSIAWYIGHVSSIALGQPNPYKWISGIESKKPVVCIYVFVFMVCAFLTLHCLIVVSKPHYYARASFILSSSHENLWLCGNFNSLGRKSSHDKICISEILLSPADMKESTVKWWQQYNLNCFYIHQ